MRVLLVDDEPLIQRVVVRIIPEHQVLPCSGPGAVEICEREKPDVAIVDLNLKDLDGLALARELRELCPDMRIVMTSGAHLDESIGFPTLSKPFDRAELLEAIHGDDNANPKDT
jgi:CheY-like chemotaxis protein